MQIESAKPHAEGGWIHALTDERIQRITPKPKKIIQRSVSFRNESARCRRAITVSQSRDLARRLGVSRLSLERLEIGWDGRSYTFPMCDANSEIIGIRLRTSDGRKYAVSGSQNGLFIPTEVCAWSEQTLYICEGESDTAAALTLGLDAIGRPSCTGSEKHIKEFLRQRRRDVVIVSDNDGLKTRPDGTQWRPGIEGARHLAQAIRPICSSVKIITPPEKDLRAWVQAGATAEAVMALVSARRFVAYNSKGKK